VLRVNSDLYRTYVSPSAQVASVGTATGFGYSLYQRYLSGSSVVDMLPKHQTFELLIGSRKGRLGDRSCVNNQVNALLTPKVTGRTVSDGLFVYDKDAAFLQAKLRQRYTDMPTLVGECAYSVQNTGYAMLSPSWGDMLYKTDPIVPDRNNVFVARRSYGFKWVPLSSSIFGLIRTVVYIGLYEHCTSSMYSNYVDAKLDTWAETVSVANGVVTYHKSAAIRRTATSRSGDFSLIWGCWLGNLDPLQLSASVWAQLDHRDDGSSVIPRVTYSNVMDARCNDEKNINDLLFHLACGMFHCVNNSADNRPADKQLYDMSLTALDQCSYTQCNSIAFLTDIRRIGSEIGDAVKLIHDPTNLRAWSQLYLGLRYGTRLTASDIQSIASGLREARSRLNGRRFSVVRSMLSEELPSGRKGWSASRELRFKIGYISDKNLLNAVQATLYDWDLLPTFENVWDLIPLSFVVDWVVNISALCDQIDKRDYVKRIDVLGCTDSYKDTYITDIDLTAYGFEKAPVSFTIYNRTTSPSLPRPRISLDWGHSSGINILDAVAILINKLVK